MTARENFKSILNQKLRVDKMISQKDFAKQLGIKPPSVIKWLDGTAVPDIDFYPSICKILNVTANQLFGIDDSSLISDEDFDLINKINQNPILKDIIINYRKD